MNLRNSSKHLLRIAAVIAFVQFAAHTFLLVTYEPRHLGEKAVVTVMKLSRFDFGGFRPHSYWELYFGYGLFAAFNCLIEAVLFWQLATRPHRAVIALFALANIGYAVLVALYFFPVPLILDLTLAALLGAAAFTASR